MKRICMLATTLFFLTAMPGFTACSPDEAPAAPGSETPQPDPQPDPSPAPDSDSDPNPDLPDGNLLEITVGQVSFTATLTDNAAVRAFKTMLPMTVQMNELNGNEKYCYLPDDLPASASRPGSIRSGDLMLYGSDCLALFYNSFPTSYSYTRLGRIDDLSGLERALDSGSVTVTFELIE